MKAQPPSTTAEPEAATERASHGSTSENTNLPVAVRKPHGPSKEVRNRTATLARRTHFSVAEYAFREGELSMRSPAAVDDLIMWYGAGILGSALGQ